MGWLHPGCVGMEPSGVHGKPEHCYEPPEWAGLTLIDEGTPAVEAHLVFACERHIATSRMIAPRRMLDRDRAVLAERRENAAWWRIPVEDRTGRPRDGQTRPLAVGADARALARRAEKWAREHPVDDEQRPARPTPKGETSGA